MTTTEVNDLFKSTQDIHSTIDCILAATDQWDRQFLMSWYDNS